MGSVVTNKFMNESVRQIALALRGHCESSMSFICDFAHEMRSDLERLSFECPHEEHADWFRRVWQTFEELRSQLFILPKGDDVAAINDAIAHLNHAMPPAAIPPGDSEPAISAYILTLRNCFLDGDSPQKVLDAINSWTREFASDRSIRAELGVDAVIDSYTDVLSLLKDDPVKRWFRSLMESSDASCRAWFTSFYTILLDGAARLRSSESESKVAGLICSAVEAITKLPPITSDDKCVARWSVITASFRDRGLTRQVVAARLLQRIGSWIRTSVPIDMKALLEM